MRSNPTSLGLTFELVGTDKNVFIEGGRLVDGYLAGEFSGVNGEPEGEAVDAFVFMGVETFFAF